MRRAARFALPVTIGLVLGLALQVVAFGPHRADQVEEYFSPPVLGQTLTPKEIIRREISRATFEIDVQMSQFTDRDIAAELVAAAKRGVNVYVLLDRSMELSPNTVAPFLINEGRNLPPGGLIQVATDRVDATANNRVMVIDPGRSNRTLLTGSYDYTRAAAQDSAENLLVIRQAPEVVDLYLNNLLVHWNHGDWWLWRGTGPMPN